MFLTFAGIKFFGMSHSQILDILQEFGISVEFNFTDVTFSNISQNLQINYLIVLSNFKCKSIAPTTFVVGKGSFVIVISV